MIWYVSCIFTLMSLADSSSQQTVEGELQLAKRRAEREAADLRQKSLKLVP